MPDEKKFGRRDRSEFDVEQSAPATKADIEELKQLILSMKPSTPIVNVSYSGAPDAVGRTMYQVAKDASRALTVASR